MQLRIASYNIRKAVGLDWKRDPARILAVLAELDADIVLLQEADRRLGSRAGVLPVDHLRAVLGYQFADVAVRPLSHGWHGNAILCRTSMSIISTSRIDLPAIEPRGAVMATIDVGSTEPLQIVCAHLSLFRKIRWQQYEVIHRMELAQFENQTVIIGGDFNDRSDKAITAAFKDKFQIVNPGASFHTSRPVWNFDRFITSHSTRTQQAGVYQTELTRKASDHLPVYLDIDCP